MAPFSQPATPTYNRLPSITDNSYQNLKPIDTSIRSLRFEIITLPQPVDNNDSIWNLGEEQEPSENCYGDVRDEELIRQSKEQDAQAKEEKKVWTEEESKETAKNRMLRKFIEKWSSDCVNRHCNPQRPVPSFWRNTTAVSRVKTSQQPSGISKRSSQPTRPPRIMQRRRSAREGECDKGGNRPENSSCLAETLLIEDEEDAMVIDSQDLLVRTGVGSEQAVDELGQGVDKMAIGHQTS